MLVPHSCAAHESPPLPRGKLRYRLTSLPQPRWCETMFPQARRIPLYQLRPWRTLAPPARTPALLTRYFLPSAAGNPHRVAVASALRANNFAPVGVAAFRVLGALLRHAGRSGRVGT